MKAKFFALFIAILMLVTTFTACSKNYEYTSSYIDVTDESTTSVTSDEDGKKGSTTSVTSGEDGKKGSTTSNSSNSGKKNSSTSSSGNKNNNNKNNSNSKNDRYKTVGNVTMAVNKNRPTDYQVLVDEFNNYYPYINLELDFYTGPEDNSSSDYITTRAASGKLPDVVYDDTSYLHTYVSQGLVYPLNSYLEKDAEYKNVFDNIKKNYTYNGVTYAVPHQAFFNCIVLNVDVLDALNLDVPDPDWTFDDFEALTKAATNSKYSGCEDLWYIEKYGSGIMSGVGTTYGYNLETRKFDLVNSFAKSLSYQRKLREVPGLEAWALRLNGTSDANSDYTKKFGNGDVNNHFMAGDLGRTAVYSTWHGTYSYVWAKQTLKFNWLIVPWPQIKEKPGRMPMHVDHSFIVSSTKNPDAAFEVVRYFSYSEEGNLMRLDMFDGNYETNFAYYVPITKNKKVAEKFSSLEAVDEYAEYMYENVSKSFRLDAYKFVPGLAHVGDTLIAPAGNKVSDGVSDAYQVCKELEAKCNTEIAKYWADFDKKLADVQAKWKANHS